MAATTVLLLIGGRWVSPRWRLPVALAEPRRRWSATLHYACASRRVAADARQMPVVYRYVDWLIAHADAGAGALFLDPDGRERADRAVLAPADRLGGDGAGALYGRDRPAVSDARLPDRLVLWLYVLGEVYFGRMREINAQSGSDPVRLGFFWLRLIVTIGWALYPLGYLIVRLGNGADVAKLMVIYNLADLINQIAFVSGGARHARSTIPRIRADDWRRNQQPRDASESRGIGRRMST